MLKRLIEVALPLKEVSEQSAREKSIRHGHISTLHIWWARRPLAACRAAVFASLIPDPDDPECPESFRSLVNELLIESDYKPKQNDGSASEDTPRNRCLEFIKHLVRWENSNNPHYVEPARKLISAAYKILHPKAEGDVPKVLDPFAGGGAIPLEALRLGCESHAIDLNPVAHLIELCTLVYPQKYGQPDSRPVPDYIKRLTAYRKAKRKAEGESTLFDSSETKHVAEADDDLLPNVTITEAEYRKNPLAADVKYWGHWILERARREIGQFYPPDPDGSVPVAYLWARTVKSPSPQYPFFTPLFRHSWLCKKGKRKVAFQVDANVETGECTFRIEQEMAKAFAAANRKLTANGLFVVVYAHKTTAAWESLVSALLKSGFKVEASWPLHTEMTGGMVKIGKAVLASSIFLVCRKRSATAGDGLWDEVRQELKPVAKERLDFFWSQGIRGADFFISAIGPALSVFGKYERVKKLSGEEVSVGQFLDEVRGLVTAYALNKIMKTTHTATIDPDSQFYVIWKWSYGEAKVPADEAFKLAQALGIDTETMWDRTGVLEKSGENVQAVAVAKRMKVKNLGEPNADNTPASLIDVLHRLCVFRDKSDTEGMTEFLGRSGQGRNPNLWLVAQAVSEILPAGDKEKQLMQGLLNQRDQLEEAGRQQKLF